VFRSLLSSHQTFQQRFKDSGCEGWLGWGLAGLRVHRPPVHVPRPHAHCSDLAFI